MTREKIMGYLPYEKPFLFVDYLEEVDDTGVTGYYTFPKDAYFYDGHFKGYPVTPGVILTECMAQIGVVCLGLKLLHKIKEDTIPLGVLINSNTSYKNQVLPRETVKVVSRRLMYRFHVLKCEVIMYTASGQEACRGVITGMVKLLNKKEFEQLIQTEQVKI